ncbi:MAG: DNA endonuclease SmrA [Methylohalobius sp.]|nr:DNA endonuclease SmrA [Methylohalobius sp.]
MSQSEEEGLFQEAMADALPLPASDKLPLPKPRSISPGQEYRREAARRTLDDQGFLPIAGIEPLAPEAVLSFKRPGVQYGVFLKLKRGEYPPGAVLDLHRLTAVQARREVYHFVHQCLQDEVRCALIIHGKGRGQCAVLKSYLARWLPMLDPVLAFHSAQGSHGGVGAVYLLLKKGALQKERNRRRFQLGER